MKLYRCVIAGLLIVFVIVGVWYIVSNYNEQRSVDGGTLVYVTDHCLY